MAKVSEVIKRLEQLKTEFGNLPIRVRNRDGSEYIFDAQTNIFHEKAKPGFLFEMGGHERILIDGDFDGNYRSGEK